MKRAGAAEVGAVEGRVLVDLAREEALAQRAVRDEADAEFLQGRDDLRLGLPPPQRVFALEGRDRLDGVGATNRLHARLGEAEVLDLALLNQFLHRPRHVLDGHVRVDPVLIEQVDDSTLSRLSEASATSLMCSGRLFSPAALLPPVGPADVEPELGGDHHLVAEGSERLAHQFLVRERAVDLGGVEECDAAFDGRPEQRDHLLLVLRRAVGQSSFPCSRGRWPRLPGRCFRVCVSACVAPSVPPRLFGLEGRHVDGEAVLHVGLEQPLVGFVDLLDGDDFDVGGDVVLAAEVEHLLRLGDAADGRAGEAAAAQDEAEGGDRQRLRRGTDEGQVAVAAEQVEVGVDVVLGGDGSRG